MGAFSSNSRKIQQAATAQNGPFKSRVVEKQGVSDWELRPDHMVEVITRLLSHGWAILIGTTREGDCMHLRVYGPGKPSDSYPNSPEALHAAWDEICEWLDSLEEPAERPPAPLRRTK